MRKPRERMVLAPGESSRRAGLAVLGVVLFAYFSVHYDNYFSVGNVTTTAQNMSAIAIASVGIMALLVSGNVDLSIGSQWALISVITATVVRDSQSAVLGVVVALACGTVMGLFNGILVNTLKISPLIVTLGMLSVYGGLAFVVAKGVSVYGFPYSFTEIAGLRVADVPFSVIVAAIALAIGAYVILATRVGLRLFAIGGNPDTARMVGIKVDRTVILSFTWCGFLMGVVALLGTSQLGSGSPNVGVQFEMDVLTAVILGGVAFAGGAGHPLGVVVGVFTLGVINSGLIFAGLEDWWQQIAKGSLLLVALGLDQFMIWWRLRRDKRLAKDRTSANGGELVSREELMATRRPPGNVVLDAHELSVSYGTVKALDRASIRVRSGEVVCLVGDNGAGKSTMIKAIAGVNALDSGSMELGGAPVRIDSPAQARAAGIETVYQDLALCSNLGVAHNLVLGEEPRRKWLGLVPMRDDRRAARTARARLATLGVELTDFARPVRMLSGGQRQAVAISRVLRDDVRLVILDEPTAALGVTQTNQVLRLVRNVAAEDRGVILISHDIEDILTVGDRVVVMRLGQVIFDGPLDTLSRLDLMHLMAGHLPEPSSGTGATVVGG